MFWFFIYFYITSILLYGVIPGAAYNYCNGAVAKKLCGHDTHTMCLKEEPYDKLMVVVPMTNLLRQSIIDKLNELRNLTASGELDNGHGLKFPKASRMREVRWDYELAYIATRLAKTCVFKHDKCRSTLRFPYAGQNIGRFSKIDSVKFGMMHLMERMFEEKEGIEDPVDIVRDHKPLSLAGHFTVMIHDYSTHVGCGITYCAPTNANPNYYFVCNYGRTNMGGSLYDVVQHNEGTASRCGDWKEGKSSRYNQLCANNGPASQPPFRKQPQKKEETE